MLLGSFGIICAIISTAVLSSKPVLLVSILSPGKPAVYMVPPLRRLNNAPIILRQNSSTKTYYSLQPSSVVFSETVIPTLRKSSSARNIQRISVASILLYPSVSYLSTDAVYSLLKGNSAKLSHYRTKQYMNNDKYVFSSYGLQDTITPSAFDFASSESVTEVFNTSLKTALSTQQNTHVYGISTHSLRSSISYTPRSRSDVTLPLFYKPTYLSHLVTESSLTSGMTPSYTKTPFSDLSNATQFPNSHVATVHKIFPATDSQTTLSFSDLVENSMTISPTPGLSLPSTLPEVSVSLESDLRPSHHNASLSQSSIVESSNSPSSPLSGSYVYHLLSSPAITLKQPMKSDIYPSMSFSDSKWIPETFSTPPLHSQIIPSQRSIADISALQSSATVSVSIPASIDSAFSRTTSPSALPFHSHNVLATWSIISTSVLQSSITAAHSVPIPTSTISASSSGSVPTVFTCAQMKSYFPTYIEIDESEPVGSVLASMPIVPKSQNTSFISEVKEPQQLANIMQGYFGVQTSASEHTLTLLKPVDVEQLYHLSGKTVPVKDILVQVHCSEKYDNTVMKETISINVTIWDEDDELPRFLNQDDDETCVVPVYKADASEDYMGELTVKPGKIVAVDGDLFVQHNISYSVMHAEPENYDTYFSLNTLDGSVNKTRLMNTSDPRKYLLFIQATEDSPQQKKKVAVLSIEVFAPSDPLGDDLSTVDPTVKLSLKVISALVILGFASGFIVVVHYRWRRKKGRVNTKKCEPCEIAREVKLPELAVYRSSVSSIECEPTDSNKVDKSGIPSISSPSQIQVLPAVNSASGKAKKVIVKKPIDTRLRPGWNAPHRRRNR